MIVFLTSSPSGPLDKPNYDKVLDESNGFVEQLKKHWKKDMKGLIITATPDLYEANDEQLDFFNTAFRNSGVPLTSFEMWDDRRDITKEELENYDMIMLGGGHVPTQNAYFKRIQLREKIKDFDGIVIGVSAGSMNSADIVYVQPEEAGESLDPNFVKYVKGLNLTQVNVLPHYQMVKNNYLDGRRLFEDITYADSYGNHFLVLVDGSYVVINNEGTFVYGESYHLGDGIISQMCKENENVKII